MDIKKIIENAETKTDILDWKIGDIYIWRYERFSIERFLTEGEVKRVRENVNIKGELLKLWIKDLPYLFKRPHKAEVLILNHSRRIFDGQKYICKYTEQISEHYENSTTLESRYLFTHFKPNKTRNLFYTDFLEAKSIIYEKMSHLINRKHWLYVYTEISSRLRDLFINITDEDSLNKLASSMTMNYYRTVSLKRQYKRLIRHVNPKVVIEVVGYGYGKMVVNELCKQLNIPTVEMQHSQIDENLIAYNWRGRDNIEQFPDYLLIYGDFWGNNLRLPIDKKNVISVGFPYFENQVNTYRRKVFDQNKKSVLFISQFLAGDAIYRLAMECSIIKPDMNIVYKLHPDEYDIWEEKYPDLVEYENITVISNPQIPLYSLFSEARACVGVFSGALYEALSFDVPVYVLEAPYSEYMDKLIEAGGAILVQSAKELLEKMECQEKSEFDIESVWKTNSFKNVISAIDEIMVQK